MTVFVEQMPSLVGRFLMRCKGAFLTVNLSATRVVARLVGGVGCPRSVPAWSQ